MKLLDNIIIVIFIVTVSILMGILIVDKLILNDKKLNLYDIIKKEQCSNIQEDFSIGYDLQNKENINMSNTVDTINIDNTKDEINKNLLQENTCNEPNKVIDEIKYQKIIPIENAMIKGYNYMVYSNAVSPDKIDDIRFLSKTTKGLNDEQGRNIPIGSNYAF